MPGTSSRTSSKAPAGYWINQTQLFLPFPAVAIDYTKVVIQQDGAKSSNVQVVVGGATVFIPSIAPGASHWYNMTVSAATTVSGPAPIVNVTQYIPLV